MSTGELLDIFYQMFILAIRIGGPILLAAMGIGIIISILQAATQIQEQTLTFVPKLLIIGILLVVMGSSMLTGLQEFARFIMNLIATN